MSFLNLSHIQNELIKMNLHELSLNNAKVTYVYHKYIIIRYDVHISLNVE
jgi:hypothetical protein